MKKLSLFSGIGGDDLASKWTSIETICFVENNKYCQQVLKKHWPEIPIIEDVKDVSKEAIEEIICDSKCESRRQETKRRLDMERHSLPKTGRGKNTDRVTVSSRAVIDIISGGFPCQPHSVAGKREGSADERNLWPEFRRIIGIFKPRWVVGENVPGIFTSDGGQFFNGIICDLAEMGYSVGWATYGAVDVGALHRRNRVFIVGYSIGNGYPDGRQEARGKVRGGEQGWMHQPAGTGIMADTTDNGLARTSIPVSERRPQQENPDTGRESKNISNAESSECEQSGQTRAGRTGFTDSDYYIEQYWQSEPDVGRVANGIPHRVDRLRGLGNAVVPQQIYPVYKAIVEIETSNKKEGRQ